MIFQIDQYYLKLFSQEIEAKIINKTWAEAVEILKENVIDANAFKKYKHNSYTDIINIFKELIRLSFAYHCIDNIEFYLDKEMKEGISENTKISIDQIIYCKIIFKEYDNQILQYGKTYKVIKKLEVIFNTYEIGYTFKFFGREHSRFDSETRLVIFPDSKMEIYCDSLWKKESTGMKPDYIWWCEIDKRHMDIFNNIELYIKEQ